MRLVHWGTLAAALALLDCQSTVVIGGTSAGTIGTPATSAGASSSGRVTASAAASSGASGGASSSGNSTSASASGTAGASSAATSGGSGTSSGGSNGTTTSPAPARFNPAVGYTTQDVFLISMSLRRSADAGIDLAIAAADQQGTIEMLLGKGDGTFRSDPNGPISIAAYPNQLCSADFDGDGVGDLAVLLNSAPDLVGMLFDTGTQGFADSGALDVPSASFGLYGIDSMVAGDWNGDGNADLAFFWGPFGIIRGLGDGGFGPLSIYDAGVCGLGTAADFDGKNGLDLALLCSDGLRVALNDGDGGFTSSGAAPIQSPPQQAVVGDFDGKNGPDVAIVSNDFHIRIYLNDGTGTLREQAITYDTGHDSQIAAGDFNLDGKADLAAASPENTGIEVWLSNGDGTLSLPQLIPAEQNGYVSQLLAADLNGDGKVDIAALGSLVVGAEGKGAVSVYLNATPGPGGGS
jgi:hypothetical protein